MGMKDQIENLKLSVADQKDKGAGLAKEVEAQYQKKMAAQEEKQKEELKAKESEIAKVKAEKKKVEEEFAGSSKTIKKLQGDLKAALFSFPENRVSDWYGFGNAMRLISYGGRPSKPTSN